MHVAINWHINVNVTLQQATKAHREIEVEFYFFFKIGNVGGWSTPLPGRFTAGNDLTPRVA
jgi:hypothetical protein